MMTARPLVILDEAKRSIVAPGRWRRRAHIDLGYAKEVNARMPPVVTAMMARRRGQSEG